MKERVSVLIAVAVFALSPTGSALAEEAPPPTMNSVLAASTESDWVALDPAETLYLELPQGRVVMVLAPEFAPRHVANIKALVAERFFDGLAVTRSQENYVVQWGDPAGEGEERRAIRKAKSSLAPEFDGALDPELPVTLLDDPDAYAPAVGFSHGFPVAFDPEAKRIWLAHCYGMLGVGRDVAPDSGSGAELYVVIGHSPRHLDRNVTLVGRVVDGMEHLSTLPRGTGPLGFYEDESEHVPITSIRLGSELPEGERVELEVMRTDTETFENLIAARRTRTESWFVEPTGRVGLCNVPLPVRPASR
jgi:peptidylprolyl isomerase